MSEYGMIFNRPDGSNMYNSAIDSWSQVGLVYIDADKSFAYDNTIFTNLVVTFWFVNIPPTTAKMLAPSFSAANGTIQFTRQGFDAYALILGR
jgi:hypothetical protein